MISIGNILILYHYWDSIDADSVEFYGQTYSWKTKICFSCTGEKMTLVDNIEQVTKQCHLWIQVVCKQTLSVDKLLKCYYISYYLTLYQKSILVVTNLNDWTSICMCIGLYTHYIDHIRLLCTSCVVWLLQGGCNMIL